MISTLAYEIGAVFLLAALLMYGTANGLVPRSLRVGKTFPMLLAAGALAFAIYRFGPDLYADWRSASAIEPGVTAAQPAPAGRTPAPVPAKSGAPPATATKQSDTHWKTIIVESVPAAADPGAPPGGKPAENAADAKTATDTKSAAKSSDSSPYDSGVTRAIKSVGRFLHVERKKEQ
jgi:hypothetical protein